MSTALTTHLRAWFGAWPSSLPPTGSGLTVLPADRRDEPGWDGQVRPLIGATSSAGHVVLAVAPRLLDEVAGLVADADAARLEEDQRLRRAVGEAAHGDGATLGVGVLRWVARGEDELDDGVAPLGSWMDHRDPRVPAWLRPFGGEALVALDEHGEYAAGVGVKRHDPTGHELAVVTDEAHRGRGLARRLVATAARAELARVPVVTYLHARENVGSARVADAVGIPDRGWRMIGVFGGAAPG